VWQKAVREGLKDKKLVGITMKYAAFVIEQIREVGLEAALRQ